MSSPSPDAAPPPDTAAETSETARVFVSYARTNQAAVRRWCEALAARGRELWVDWEGIPPSAEWMAQIETGIREADAFVFMMSPAALASTVCRQELDIAAGLDKRLVPVVIEDVAPAEAPPALARLNWIFLRAGDDADAGLARLEAALDTDLDWLKRHTALMRPALAWQDAGRERSRLLKGQALKQAEAWLTESAQKSPAPADVQLAFIQASQQAARTRLRLALAGALVGLVSLAALSLWAVLAERRADAAREEAVARQLGSDASLVASEQAALIETSALLAIESWKRRPALGNDVPLRQALRLLPRQLARWSHPGQRIRAAQLIDGGRMVVYAEADRLHLQRADGTAPATIVTLPAQIRSVIRCGAAGAFVARTDADQVRYWRDARSPPEALEDATAVTCSADGRIVALGQRDGHIRFHATDASAPPPAPSDSLDAPVERLRFSDDGRFLAASGAKHLRLWALTADSARSLAALKGRQPVADIDFSPAGDTLLAAADAAAYVWHLPDARLVKRLGELTNVHRARFSPDGRLIALGVGDGSVVIYDARRLERIRQMRHGSPVHHLAFSADSRLLLSGSNDATARLWRIADGSEQLRFSHADFITAIDWPDGAGRMLSAGRDGAVKLWAPGLFEREVVDGPRRAVAVQANVDAIRVAPGAADLLEPLGAHRWQLRAQGDAAPTVTFAVPEGVVTFALSPDRSVLAVSQFDGRVSLRHLPDGRLLRTLTIGAPSDTVGFSPDGTLLLTGSRDGQVRLWAWATGTVRWQQAHAPFIFAHAFSADGRLVATGGSDASARVWQVADGRERHRFAHRHDVRALAFHPTRALLASASSDHMGRLWSLETGQVTRYLPHRGPVLAIAFSADGTRVATGSSDRTARLWRTDDGVEQSRIQAPSAVFALGFDGPWLRLFTGGEWSRHPVDPAAVVTATCARLTHNLGPIDWLRYVRTPTPQATCPGLPVPRF
ncbi:TIR domain-containing protein [Nitrogeniibacter mangrovi]|uniref:TIR domain-containing protein n=1 Tax=Nitrogeniibacter mangrovi TaxID=2016596 RepID=A0A6C1B3A7_9RHOO|nr:TIR domain-containing protein [Nitrogeniibacter mangrovi]QID16694.1 TIR domain-containing protein [Nitrogeniibacter mangrovi]